MTDRDRLTLMRTLLAFVWGTGVLGVQARAIDVVVDPGHTPARPGASTVDGRPEYGYNLALAGRLAQVLAQRGLRVERSDAAGAELPLAERTARTGEARLFVSIHHDSIQQAWIDRGWRDRYQGFSLFVSPRNPAYEQSLQCARRIGTELRRAGEAPSLYHATPIPGEDRPLLDRPNGVHRFDDLVVLHTAQSPAVLVEIGVIANPAQAARLALPVVVETLARAVAAGVQACLASLPQPAPALPSPAPPRLTPAPPRPAPVSPRSAPGP